MVVDASVLAPEVIDREVASVLHRAGIAGRLPQRRVDPASDDLIDLPLRRVAHRPLLHRCRELRHTLTSYDAAHVALTEVLGIVLVTADARLSRAPGTTCEVDVVR
ncbi:type II toxin-antitoxin system VapC family toxin [Kineococcus sp. GCM10028916]|uniref:type II toxin-antitoxin system VapC family toxin n=1 Tax=Kineococcus sp. GCM10028916 TaxID=3273394 RepID=UPI003632D73B